MKKHKICILLFFISVKIFSQPYVDLASFNYQTFSSTYKGDTHRKNKTDDYFLNLFLPAEFANGNAMLVRLNVEMLNSTIVSDTSYSSKLYGVSMPIGYQFSSENRKWKTIVMGIPKIASDFKDVNNYDYQLGGIFLETFVVKGAGEDYHSAMMMPEVGDLKLKAGLYYNREAFGNFFMPLVGIDWRATPRINLYGVLPANFKVEFETMRDKLHTGFNFKSLTRSFRLSYSENNNYVRYNEMQLKLFLDYFIPDKHGEHPHWLVNAEVGYSIGKSPLEFMYKTKNETFQNPVYNPLKNYLIFNIGIAYRIRFDFSPICRSRF